MWYALQVLTDVESEQENDFKARIVRKLLKGSTLSEKQQEEAVERYIEEARAQEQTFRDRQAHSNDIVAAKLAARRRMKEERSKEDAMKKELQELGKRQVRSLSALTTILLLCGFTYAKNGG